VRAPLAPWEGTSPFLAESVEPSSSLVTPACPSVPLSLHNMHMRVHALLLGPSDKLRPHARDCVQAGVSVVPQHEYLSIRAAAIVPHLTPSLLRRHSRASRRASRRSLVVRASTWHGRRRVAAPRPASHANACALPGPRHSFARDGEDTSRSGSVLRAYCILDAELSDVIVFAAPRSTPAAARARAPPLLRSNTLNFMALQIRVGA